MPLVDLAVDGRDRGSEQPRSLFTSSSAWSPFRTPSRTGTLKVAVGESRQHPGDRRAWRLATRPPAGHSAVAGARTDIFVELRRLGPCGPRRFGGARRRRREGELELEEEEEEGRRPRGRRRPSSDAAARSSRQTPLIFQGRRGRGPPTSTSSRRRTRCSFRFRVDGACSARFRRIPKRMMARCRQPG